MSTTISSVAGHAVLAIHFRDGGVVLGLCTRQREVVGRVVTADPLAFVLRVRGGPDDSDVEASLKEARRLVRLRHRHLQRVVEAGETELRLDDTSPRVTRVAYALYEPVEGATLREWVDERRPDAPEIIEHAIHVGSALRVLHEQKVVHRHVTPDDVVIDATGAAVLCLHPLHRQPTTAIGLTHVRVAPAVRTEAPLASPDAPPPRDVSPLRRGWTPARYLAPEARLGQWSTAVDEWGLGVTAWELLTGQHPYESNDDAAMTTLANRTHDPEVLAQLRRVIGVLRRSVDLDPARRWGSAARLCSALVATRAEGGPHDFDRAPSASRQPGPPPPYSPASHPTALAQPQTRATTPRPRGNRTTIAMFLVAVWIAVFAGVVWYLAGRPI